MWEIDTSPIEFELLHFGINGRIEKSMCADTYNRMKSRFRKTVNIESVQCPGDLIGNIERALIGMEDAALIWNYDGVTVVGWVIPTPRQEESLKIHYQCALKKRKNLKSRKLKRKRKLI